MLGPATRPCASTLVEVRDTLTTLSLPRPNLIRSIDQVSADKATMPMSVHIHSDEKPVRRSKGHVTIDTASLFQQHSGHQRASPFCPVRVVFRHD